MFPGRGIVLSLLLLVRVSFQTSLDTLCLSSTTSAAATNLLQALRSQNARVTSALLYTDSASGSDELLDFVFNSATAAIELDLATDVDVHRGALKRDAASLLAQAAAASSHQSPLHYSMLVLIVRGLDALSSSNVTAVNVLMRLLDQGLTVDTVDGVLSLSATPSLVILLPFDSSRVSPKAENARQRTLPRAVVSAYLSSLLAAVEASGSKPIRAVNPHALMGRVASVVQLDGLPQALPRPDSCLRRAGSVPDRIPASEEALGASKAHGGTEQLPLLAWGSVGGAVGLAVLLAALLLGGCCAFAERRSPARSVGAAMTVQAPPSTSDAAPVSCGPTPGVPARPLDADASAVRGRRGASIGAGARAAPAAGGGGGGAASRGPRGRRL